MGTGKWPYLDVVWVAFETGSLLAVVGGGAVRGFRREALSTIKAAGLGHVPGDVLVSRLLQQVASVWLPLPGPAREFLFSSQLTRRIQAQQTEEGQELLLQIL